MDHNVMKSAARVTGDGWKSIAWWKEAHRLQLALCDDLEAIADSLPSSIINHDCLFASKCLVRLIRDVHAYEEETLFPALRQVFQRLAAGKGVDCGRLHSDYLYFFTIGQ